MQNPFERLETQLIIIENLVHDLIHATAKKSVPLESDQWLDLSGLCDYHPDEPAKATVYGWVHAGIIPHHKGGKKLRFLKSEIDQWLKTGKKKTAAELVIEIDSYLSKKKGGKAL